MKIVRLGKFNFSASWLGSISLEEAKKQTAKNTPEKVIESLWIEVNGKPKKEKPEPKKKSKSED
jgi:hypothetical protein